MSHVEVSARVVLAADGSGLAGVTSDVLDNNQFAGADYLGGMSIPPSLTRGRLLWERLAQELAVYCEKEDVT